MSPTPKHKARKRDSDDEYFEDFLARYCSDPEPVPSLTPRDDENHSHVELTDRERIIAEELNAKLERHSGAHSAAAGGDAELVRAPVASAAWGLACVAILLAIVSSGVLVVYR